jgi:hypothetical protein
MGENKLSGGSSAMVPRRVSPRTERLPDEGARRFIVCKF